MNVHPLFTHFPVALLTLYCLFELVRFKKVLNLPYWFYVKASLVICGTLSGYLTFLTGDVIARQFRAVRSLVYMHSLWASVTLVVFTAISAAYLIEWMEKSELPKKITGPLLQQFWALLLAIKSVIFYPLILILAALLGLVAISITGALGGAIAYGPEIDPFVKFVYGLFF